ncbi:hypothetical protein Efla_003184 [Eimeria flavescens]
MVWVEDWRSFTLAVRDIFLHSPTTARYTLKYRRSDCLLCIKVTDNITVSGPASVFSVCLLVCLCSSSPLGRRVFACLCVGVFLLLFLFVFVEARRAEKLSAAFLSWSCQRDLRGGVSALTVDASLPSNPRKSGALSSASPLLSAVSRHLFDFQQQQPSSSSSSSSRETESPYLLLATHGRVHACLLQRGALHRQQSRGARRNRSSSLLQASSNSSSSSLLQAGSSSSSSSSSVRHLAEDSAHARRGGAPGHSWVLPLPQPPP